MAKTVGRYRVQERRQVSQTAAVRGERREEIRRSVSAMELALCMCNTDERSKTIDAKTQ